MRRFSGGMYAAVHTGEFAKRALFDGQRAAANIGDGHPDDGDHRVPERTVPGCKVASPSRTSLSSSHC
jgi:hypothetical protein